MARLFILFSLILIQSCKGDKGSNTDSGKQISDSSIDTTSESFFPVTEYIKGQINDIKTTGINPIKYITTGNKKDSVWLKVEELSTEMKGFTEPVIEAYNLVDLFEEKKFLDQTLNAFTFTYEPKKILPATLNLKHWDIYVDPNTNKIKRIYLVKDSAGTTQQLTWQSDKWCKVVHLKQDGDSIKIEKEELIKWDF